MDFNCDIPEEFVDILVQDFAYDPIRLAVSDDPSQVLYNRRTLEAIWDSKRVAMNPYTRKPFHIGDVIPQTEVRQRMCQYILKKSSQGIFLGLHVIPDYTQVLNETAMKDLLKETVVAAIQCSKKAKKRRNPSKRKRNADAGELELWNALWRKLNLVRLYCQYRVENRELFCSIKGYEYLFKVISTPLLNSCYSRTCNAYTCDDAKEACKEVVRIVDVVGGLKKIDLQMARRTSVKAFLGILDDLVLDYSEYFKTQSMVLRICRLILEHWVLCFDLKKDFIFDVAGSAVCVLAERESTSDIVNEDVYNGMAILKAAAIDNIYCVSLGVVHEIVTICISRLQDLHDDAQPISCPSHDTGDNGELENNNINLISKALEHGLFVISSQVPHPEIDNEPLRKLDILNQIFRMRRLASAGNKLFQLTHLEFGQKIIATLCGMRN